MSCSEDKRRRETIHHRPDALPPGRCAVDKVANAVVIRHVPHARPGGASVVHTLRPRAKSLLSLLEMISFITAPRPAARAGTDGIVEERKVF